MAGLPAGACEFGVLVILLRVAEAEIGNEGPVRGHGEVARQAARLEDRDPSEPKPLGPRGEPELADRADDGIAARLGHGRGAQTGALIRVSAEAGAILAKAPKARQSFAAYAQHLGLAFQIRDDILDVEGDEDVTGKRMQKDAEAGKATFVSLLGLEAARKAAEDEVQAAIAALAPYGEKAHRLREAAEFAIHRVN